MTPLITRAYDLSLKQRGEAGIMLRTLADKLGEAALELKKSKVSLKSCNQRLRKLKNLVNDGML